jgi:GNAT superfamily N-acetyltransferase
VQRIFSEQFAGAPREDIENLGDRLRHPFHKRFRTVLYVGENARGHVVGFALVLHDPALSFAYLDYLATTKKSPGRGIGAALYEYLREDALGMKARGIYFECLPDDPAMCPDDQQRRANASRLQFYERYGARPFAGTAYESPIPGVSTTCLPYLMYDGLGESEPPPAVTVRKIVRAVLERKYSDLCPPSYVDKVVASFKDPLRLREPRYARSAAGARPARLTPRHLVAMTVNDRHDIHHIRDRGYVESPVRIKAILAELEPSGLMQQIPVRPYPMRHINAVHDPEYVNYLRRACAEVPHGRSVYPYVFRVRKQTRPPKEL